MEACLASYSDVSKIDLRTKAVDVPDQNAITKDNVPVNVNAVIYYKVVVAEKAILEIEDFQHAVMQYAQTTMRNVVGEVTLDELLASRDHVANRIEQLVEEVSSAWGLDVSKCRTQRCGKLPENMERTIAKQAEAEREKRAVIITSEGGSQHHKTWHKLLQLCLLFRSAPSTNSSVYQRHFIRSVKYCCIHSTS